MEIDENELEMGMASALMQSPAPPGGVELDAAVMAEASERAQARLRKKAAMPMQQARAPRMPRRVHYQADTNVMSLQFGSLAGHAEQVFAGDPQQCGGCSAVFNKHSELRRPAPGRMPDDSVWTCEFCGHANVLDLVDDELPTSEVMEYVLAPPPMPEPGEGQGAEAAGDAGAGAADSSQVLFCIDISGSMCVTSEIEGDVKLRGAAAGFDPEADLAALGLGDDDEDLRYAREMIRRQAANKKKTTWVSRLQAVQAAVAQQLELLEKQKPNCKGAFAAARLPFP